MQRAMDGAECVHDPMPAMDGADREHDPMPRAKQCFLMAISCAVCTHSLMMRTMMAMTNDLATTAMMVMLLFNTKR